MRHYAGAVAIDLHTHSSASDGTEAPGVVVQRAVEAGLSTIGRVLTLIVITDHVRGSESAIEAANEASREHPCRVIVVIRGPRADADRLDGQIRVGGDAGAAEVVVLRTSGAMASQSAAPE